MVRIRPLRGLRPKKEFAAKVASPPYDVLNSEEARELARNNPYSFLHVNKPEIDLEPGINPYDRRVYEKGAENLQKLIRERIFVQDQAPCFYIYRQIMGSHEQAGLVVGAAVEDYEKDIIKKHELTRPDKEEDRVNHILHLNAQVGPVFLTYKAQQDINRLFHHAMEKQLEYDFTSEDGVRHTFWVVDDAQIILQIQNAFRQVDRLYVADGHHRSAAAMRVKQLRQSQNPDHTGEEAYNYFLTVIFPHDQMQILDYNRVVKDLNGLTDNDFYLKLEKDFQITPSPENKPYRPEKSHTFGMYLNGRWYRLQARQSIIDDTHSIRRLDVSILQSQILEPILGIKDPRQDKRIDFVGGIRGLGELQRRVDSRQWAVAFTLYPTSIDDLIAVADAGKTMPPKSTWFEPKLRSGLVVHLLD